MRWEIERQRLALLRLLAGWLAVVAFLSLAPLAPVWTRRVRSALSSVLGRAEAAAQCLLFVQARLLAESRGIAVDRVLFPQRRFDLLLIDGDAAEPPSMAALRRRLGALRCLLRNLPRRARRVLRRLETVYGADSDTGPRALDASEGIGVRQCHPPRRWRPPERGSPVSS